MPKSRNNRKKKKHTVSDASRKRQRANKFRNQQRTAQEKERRDVNRTVRLMGLPDIW